MKIKFKSQSYQTAAVKAVVDCFEGQPDTSGQVYRIDPGRRIQGRMDEDGFPNADIALTQARVLENIRKVQKCQNLPLSESLGACVDDKGIPVKNGYKPGATINLDIEMETGTGKTYCYIKSIFEMNKHYGWSKFIIMVPSVAIREGVAKSLEMTAEHFIESHGKKARFFIYNSRRLHELENFSSDAGINVMVINVQAFNATGADNRRIYEELDDFQSRRPIDVIAANRPILILDEPQKMEGTATRNALPKFNPLFILRYSATHRTIHNKVHRLDAVDAYEQKLVKKIAVRGIEIRGLTGTHGYLYLEGIEVSKQAPVAHIEMEVKLKSGKIKRERRRLENRDDLFKMSNKLEQYRDLIVSDIDARDNTVKFTNGKILNAGQAIGDISEDMLRQIQIRETIKAHFERERQLFTKGIKVLSLFFIDEVVKYRDYDAEHEKGEYARIFEKEYEALKSEYLCEPILGDEAWHRHLGGIEVGATHNGYFSIDKKGRMVDPKIRARGEFAGLTDDVSSYDLILKDKERLLSFEEPTRFIFSHSALREGWDNPNVFVICMLKHGDNTISRRQETGRGLRLCVDQNGNRMDRYDIVHDINVLTVIAAESYADFVAGLQREISDTLSWRPQPVNQEYFIGKNIGTESKPFFIEKNMAVLIYQHLVKNAYIDADEQITKEWFESGSEARSFGWPDDLEPYINSLIKLIDVSRSGACKVNIRDGRKPKNKFNKIFYGKEFQELWERINRKAIYHVMFDREKLIEESVKALNQELRVEPLQYEVRTGVSKDKLTEKQIREGEGFSVTTTQTESGGLVHSPVKYDLLGKTSKVTGLLRGTVAQILTRIKPFTFKGFSENPEYFIAESSRIIKEQKAKLVIEHLAYDELNERHEARIFETDQTVDEFSNTMDKLDKHIHDFVVVDSDIEKKFVEGLEASNEVVVYSKLPRGFFIPTPVGNHTPDWAIYFKSDSVRHIYFIAETKGNTSSLELRDTENIKIECARKFFKTISQDIPENQMKYDTVESYEKLMSLVMKNVT